MNTTEMVPAKGLQWFQNCKKNLTSRKFSVAMRCHLQDDHKGRKTTNETLIKIKTDPTVKSQLASHNAKTAIFS